jgi:hypothetical protein
MGWATPYIDKLKRGETVQFRLRGNSMNGFQYLHLVKAVQGKRFQIGNNRGHINGWIGANGIYGKCVRIE